MKKLTLLFAGGIGYVLGAKAGRSATNRSSARVPRQGRPPGPGGGSEAAEPAKEQAPSSRTRSPGRPPRPR